MITFKSKGKESLKKCLDEHFGSFYKNLSCRQLVDPNHIFIALADSNGKIFYSSSVKNLYNVELFVKSVKQYFSVLNLGDTVLTNDPHHGTMHIKDHYLLSPFYFDNEIAGYVVVGSQLADVGGKNIGNYFPSAKDLFQEGVRTTPIRLSRSGKVDSDVLGLLKLNSRLPLLVENDLLLMNRIVTSLANEFKEYFMPEIAEELIGNSENAVSKLVSLLTTPSGALKSNIKNICGDDVDISLKICVVNETIQVDFEDIQEYQLGFIHSTLATSSSAVSSAIVHMTNCVPNSGVINKLKINIGEKTLLNCSKLKPVGWSPYSPYSEIENSVISYLKRFTTPKMRIYSSTSTFRPKKHLI